MSATDAALLAMAEDTGHGPVPDIKT